MARLSKNEKLDKLTLSLGSAAWKYKDPSNYTEYDRLCERCDELRLNPDDHYTRIRLAEIDNESVLEVLPTFQAIRDEFGLEREGKLNPVLYGRHPDRIEEDLEALRHGVEDVEALQAFLPHMDGDHLEALSEAFQGAPVERLERGLANLHGLIRKRLRASYLAFAPVSLRAFAAYINPLYEVWHPHHQYLIWRLEEVAKGTAMKLCVSLPPGAAKSTYCSQLFPAWLMGRDGSEKFLGTSHSQGLAEHHSRHVRDIIQSDAYRDVFPNAEIRGDNRAAGNFGLTNGAGYKALSVEGAISGYRASILLVDDPVSSAAQAANKKELDRQYKWLRVDALTRDNGNMRVVIIATRWSNVDLIGRLEQDMEDGIDSGWEIINLPAIATEEDVLGRMPGESICPAIYPIEKLLGIRMSMPLPEWSALYQGEPMPSEGGTILRSEWIEDHRWNSPPPSSEVVKIICSVDTASKTSKRNDYTAMAIIQQTRDGHFYVPAVKRLKAEFLEMASEVAQFANDNGATVVVVEDAGAGTVLMQTCKLHGAYFEAVKSQGSSKEYRVEAAANLFRDGKVHFPTQRDSLLDTAVTELVTFPQTKHDDLCDSVVQGLNYFRKRGGERKAKAVSLSSWLRGRKAA